MAKRAFIVHRWGAQISSDWYPWLRDELTKAGISAWLVDVPDTDDPKPEKWVAKLQNEVGKPDEETFLIGHSLGAQTILKYLELPARVGGAVLVAPWPRQTKKDQENPEYIGMSKRWLSREPKWETIAKNTMGTIAIFSDDDPFVPVSDSTVFKEKLGAKIIIEKGKGHFGDTPPQVLELPSARDAVLELAKKSGKK